MEIQKTKLYQVAISHIRLAKNLKMTTCSVSKEVEKRSL